VEMINGYAVVAERPEGKRQLGCRKEDNIKTNVKNGIQQPGLYSSNCEHSPVRSSCEHSNAFSLFIR
jgi:hypothetical protein